MRNIKLMLEYDGTRYDGWQTQHSKKGTIHEKISAVLTEMEGTPVELIGAIRTEAGTHAYQQVANFKTESHKKILEIEQYCNRYLPRDIAVINTEEADERFHASFMAKGFVFEYHFTMGKVPSVFDRRYNYYCFKKLNLDLMNQAAETFIGTHDLRAFSDNRKMKKSTVRTVNKIGIYGDEQYAVLRIEADDFWPNMARIIIGTLSEVGEGIRKPESIKELIEEGNREKAGEIIDPKGLFLSKVIY